MTQEHQFTKPSASQTYSLIKRMNTKFNANVLDKNVVDTCDELEMKLTKYIDE